ncbi:MAG: sigma-70 factor domain-containing protein, partial [Anaerolineales bacterium]|nr:sigma-70 factor domain-containing protein [Anaerolineales bacterium]
MPRKSKSKPRIPRYPQGAALPEPGPADLIAAIPVVKPVEPGLDEEPEDELEPDVTSILQNGEDVSDLSIEEPLDLRIPALAVELSDDPVRLYLREIGQVKLLDADSEFRLATMIEARRLILTLARRRTSDRRAKSNEVTTYHDMLGELITAWGRMQEDARRLGTGLPDAALMLSEAQMLHQTWETKTPSYLRSYLESEMWGKDPLWDSLVRHTYNVFLSFYTLPEGFSGWLLKHLRAHNALPAQRTLYRNLPDETELKRE